MSVLRAPLIAAALTMVSCTAFAQQGTVRIITPDSEHVYSADPRKAGQLLDDEALQRENERKQRAKMEREYQRDQARRQEELDAAAARAAAATAPFMKSNRATKSGLTAARLALGSFDVRLVAGGKSGLEQHRGAPPAHRTTDSKNPPGVNRRAV